MHEIVCTIPQDEDEVMVSFELNSHNPVQMYMEQDEKRGYSDYGFEVSGEEYVNFSIVFKRSRGIDG